MLFGRPVSGICADTSRVAVGTTSSVWSTSLLKYNVLPSGWDVTPCGMGIPMITSTTSFVVGSMMWTLSPAAFVWMMRTLPDWALNGAARKAIPSEKKRTPETRGFIMVTSCTNGGLSRRKNATLHAHSLPDIPLRGIFVSLMAAWYTNEAMMTAFFIRSSMGSVSKKSRLV